MENDIFEFALQHWQFYFLATADKKSRVWLFSNDHKWPSVEASSSFGGAEFYINLTDLFEWRIPVLVNYESVTREEIKVPFRRMAILDSNLVSYLHQFVCKEPALTLRQSEAIIDFLKFLVSNNIDYNPFYYFIEAAAKNDHTFVMDFARRMSSSILTLHTMDAKVFLSTGKVVADPKQLEIYAEEYGTQEIGDIAKIHASHMIGPTDFRWQWICNLTYAALLKTALIHKKLKVDIVGKYEKLLFFMEETFNIALGIERILSLGYFAGMHDGFIPVQRGSNSTRTLARCRAAAWDLLLLQLPPWLLLTEIEGAIPVAFVSSSDKVVTQLARTCRFDAVLGMAPKLDSPLPMMSVDLPALGLPLDRQTLDRIRDLDREWAVSRSGRLHKHEKRIGEIELDRLIKELEGEVTEFCNS